MLAALIPIGMANIDQNNNTFIAQWSHQFAAHEVGSIPNKDGWHLNVRLIDQDFDLSTLEPYRIIPANPVCVWA